MSSTNENNPGIPPVLVFVALLMVGAAAFFLGQNERGQIRPQIIEVPVSNLRGAELARTLCASCHLKPAPDIATRDRWALEILPAKADLLGVGASTNTAVISQRDWRAVCNFYLAQAPDEMPTVEDTDRPLSDRFEAVTFNHPTATRMTMGRIDPTDGVIYVGNADDRSIDVITPDGRLLAARPMDLIPTAAEARADGLYVALSSSSDEADGRVVLLGKPGSSKPDLQILVDRLKRPADLAVADLDGSGQPEIIVAHAAGLLLLRGGQAVELATNASYRAVAVADLNSDHRPEVLALRSGQQVLEVHMNAGEGNFSSTNHTQRHPAWHYSDVLARPLRRGEPPGIITANGNDGRFRRQPLPRMADHGVYLAGRGKLAALQSAHRIIARDFDGDEDLDIVAIGYSGDHRVASGHGAIYLEQQRDRSFKVHHLPNSENARWSDVDAGDVDRDGDPDVVLTAYHPGERNAPEARRKQWDESPTTCLLLLNQTIP